MEKSYSTESLLKRMVAAGCPMPVTSVKTDEYLQYERICREVGATDRLRLISDKNEFRNNFLAEILKTSSPADAASFIMDMGAAAGERHDEGAAIWKNMEHGAYRYGIRLAQLAYGGPTIRNVYEIIRTTPDDMTHARTALFDFENLHPEASAFAKAMNAVVKLDNSAHNAEYNRIQAFFMGELCSTDKIRGSVISGVMGTLGRLVDEPWQTLLGSTTLTPEAIQRDRLVAVVAMPVMQYHEPARLFNSLWVMMAQRYLMARDARGFTEPFVIVRDEAGWVISAEWDSKAHNVLRSQKCCSVAIVQCLDTLNAALGGSKKAEHEAMAFGSNHMHKLFFRNASKATNDWASSIIGDEREIFVSGGHRDQHAGVMDAILGSDQCFNWNEQYQARVRSDRFGRLNIGQAILHTAGRHTFVNFREGK